MKKKWIVPFCISILLIISAISFFALGYAQITNDDTILRPRIVIRTMDYLNQEVRVNEQNVIYVVDVPDDSEFQWDMGDSTEHIGNPITHAYNCSEHFTIKVDVVHGSSKGSASVTIPVYNNHIYEYDKQEKPFKVIAVRAHMSPINDHSFFVDLPKSATDPVLKVYIRMTEGVGTFEFSGRLINNTEVADFKTTRYSVIGKTYNYGVGLGPNDYNAVLKEPIKFGGVVHRLTGDCSLIEIWIKAYYYPYPY